MERESEGRRKKEVRTANDEKQPRKKTGRTRKANKYVKKKKEKKHETAA